MDKEPDFKRINVTKDNKTMPVYVPIVEDKIEQRDLDQMAKESNFGFEKKKDSPKKLSPSDQILALKDIRDYKERSKGVNKRKYY